MNKTVKGTYYKDGRRYRYTCDLGSRGETKNSEESLKKLILAAAEKPGVDIKKGREKKITLNNSTCTLIEELVNYIDLNIESNYSKIGYYIALACLILLGIGGSSGFLANNVEKFKSLQGFSGLTYFIGLLLLIVLSVIPYFKNLRTKLLDKDATPNLIILLVISVFTLASLYIILVPKPSDKLLKDTYGGTSSYNKFYYYVDQIFSINVRVIIGLAITCVIIFLALKIDLTIPLIIVILLAGTSIVSMLFGSLNALLSLIEMFKHSTTGFDVSGLSIVGFIINLFLFGGDLFSHYSNNKNKTKMFLHGDVFVMAIIILSSLITFFRKGTIPANVNKFLASTIFVIITYIVYKKNSFLVEKMNKNSDDLKKLSPTKEKIASMTGVFSDLLFKLYNVFFGKSEALSEDSSIGTETNKYKSIFWLVLYLFMGGITQNSVVTKYNSSVLRTVLAILVVGIGRLCLKTVTTDKSLVINGIQPTVLSTPAPAPSPDQVVPINT